LKKYRDKGYYEVLFLNEKGNAAEGAISNILIQTGKEMITPPVKDGILNGCYRQYILTKTNLKEQSITLEQLINSEKVILINSIRKELVVNKIFDSTGKLLREFH
jgi:para-aminobenzoate synthetase/4-amino-4-deoxychorismate lyase